MGGGPAQLARRTQPRGTTLADTRPRSTLHAPPRLPLIRKSAGGGVVYVETSILIENKGLPVYWAIYFPKDKMLVALVFALLAVSAVALRLFIESEFSPDAKLTGLLTNVGRRASV